MSEVTAAEIDACAAEPIRIPGAIQPHGALIVVDPHTLTLRHASENLRAVTGLDLRPGQSLTDADDARFLAAELRRWNAKDDPTFFRAASLGRAVMQVTGHVTPQGLVLEFEEAPSSEAESLEGLYPRLRKFLEAVSGARDVAAIARAAVAEVAALTGFNRVMLYSFDEKGDGAVLAETGDGVLPSFFGHHFPASDIPPQARDLYRLNRIRMIATAAYQPSPVTPAISPVDGKPLDLSFAALRSVSPVHLEYMRNMGTWASMSLSILVDGELWGLISAHNREPRGLNPQVRTACDVLGQIVSLQIEARLTADRNAERLALKAVETRLLSQLSATRDFQSGLAQDAQDWMALARGHGAAVVTQGEVTAVGETPDADEVLAIAQWLGAQNAELYATDALSEAFPAAQAFADTASGLLAASISQIRPDYLLWFRPEVVRTIDWSGDPSKPMQPAAGRLHPRTSFDTWRQQVRGKSPPWTQAQRESAEGFRNSIQNLVMRRAEERAQLTERLERVNKELESFSYSISHDLRAPFRHIVGFAELLSDREPDLDERSKHYLQSMSDAALSAGRLVDDLLNFSQLGRSSLKVSAVDMQKLTDEVIRSMGPDIEGRAIDWQVGALPSALGDPAMIRQVLQNLLQNAVKYTAPRDPAVIAISAEDRGGEVAYKVADNGVGFDMAYVHKLFGVFQRLHGVEQFEGSGIGLALVKRIVERHNGVVSAEGQTDGGATFTFTLPKRLPADGENTRG